MQPGVDRSTGSLPSLVDDGDPFVRLREPIRDRTRTVGRAVVDDHDLSRRRNLLEHAAHRRVEIPLGVVDPNHHANVVIADRAAHAPRSRFTAAARRNTSSISLLIVDASAD